MDLLYRLGAPARRLRGERRDPRGAAGGARPLEEAEAAAPRDRRARRRRGLSCWSSALSFRPGAGANPRSGAGPGRDSPAAAPTARARRRRCWTGSTSRNRFEGKPLLRIKADRTVGYGTAGGPRAGPLRRREGHTHRLSGRRRARHGPRGPRRLRRAHARVEAAGQRAVDGHRRRARGDRHGPVPSRRSGPSKRRRVVHFTRGTVDLTAPSASYDLHQKVVHFSGPVEGASGGAETGGLTHISARQGLYRREPGVPDWSRSDRRLPHGRPPGGGTPGPQARQRNRNRQRRRRRQPSRVGAERPPASRRVAPARRRRRPGDGGAR